MNKSFNAQRGRSRTNRHMSSIDITREMLATAETYITRVVSKEDKIRMEALRLVNEYHGKTLNFQEGKKLLQQVIAFNITCNTIRKNLSYLSKTGQGVIPICNKINGDKLNDIIDSCNEFVNINPQMGMHKNHKTDKYEQVKKLKHIDLVSSGVIMYLNGITLPDIEHDVVKTTTVREATAYDKKVIASKATHQLGDILS